MQPTSTSGVAAHGHVFCGGPRACEGLSPRATCRSLVTALGDAFLVDSKLSILVRHVRANPESVWLFHSHLHAPEHTGTESLRT